MKRALATYHAARHCYLQLGLCERMGERRHVISKTGGTKQSTVHKWGQGQQPMGDFKLGQPARFLRAAAGDQRAAWWSCTAFDKMDYPNNMAGAAGCSPKAASDAGNGPWYTACCRARDAEAAAGRTGAARRSDPCVNICWGAHGAGSNSRARHTLRLARRLLLHSSSVPWVNGPREAIAHGAERRIATLATTSAARSFNSPHPLPAFGNGFNPTTRQMQLAAVPKLLPTPGMARGIQHAGACEVQGRLLAALMPRDHRNFVSSFAGVHMPLAD